MTLPAELQRRVSTLIEVFDGDFRRYRRDFWAPGLQRKFPPVIPKQILASASEGFSIQSPKVEKTWKEHVKLTTDNDTEIEVIDQGGTKDSKAATENIRLWLETLWHTPEFNHGKRLDTSAAENQIGPNGVEIWRLHATIPNEGTFDAQGKDYDKAREEWFKAQKPWHVTTEDPLTCAWGPKLADGDFEQFVQQGVISYTSASELEDDDGVKATDLFTLEELGFIGSVTTEEMLLQVQGKSFEFVRYEYKDKAESKKLGYECWYFEEYILPAGGTLEKNGKALKKGKLPLRRSSYFVIESGDATVSENTNPHLRFRSQIYPLLVLVHTKNLLDSLLFCLAFMALSDDRVTANIGRMSAEGAQLFAQLGGELGGYSEEGEGASRQAVIRLPRKAASDEINVVPGPLEKFPMAGEVIPAMEIAYADVKEDIAAEETNQRLLGRSYLNTRQETGAVGSLEFQASGIPYGPHLRKSDAIKEKLFRAILDCIIAWDPKQEGDKPRYKDYPATTTGRERKADPGKTIKITVEDAQRPFIITCDTSAESPQDVQQRHAESWADWERGAIIWEDHLKNLGQDNPYEYSRKLAKEGEVVLGLMELQPTLQTMRRVSFQNATGIDPTLLMQINMVLSGGVPQDGAGDTTTGGPGGGSTDVPTPNSGLGTAPAVARPSGGGGGIQ